MTRRCRRRWRANVPMSKENSGKWRTNSTPTKKPGARPKPFSATPYASTIAGLNMAQFNQCVSSNKFQDKINADNQMAQDFGISGTPAFFVNDQFFGGVVQYSQLQQAIDTQLAK